MPETMNSNAMLIGVIISGDNIQLKALTDGMGGNLQVLQSKCLRLATGAPWYVSNRQIHEDLCVPLFLDHIMAVTASFDSRSADVGNPQYGNSADTYADRGLTPLSDAIAKGGRGQQASQGYRPRWPSRLKQSRSALIIRASFCYPD